MDGLGCLGFFGGVSPLCPSDISPALAGETLPPRHPHPDPLPSRERGCALPRRPGHTPLAALRWLAPLSFRKGRMV